MGVKLLGGSPINGAPHQSSFFCLLVWDGCHVVSTTCNDRWSLRDTFVLMGVLQAPSCSMVKSWWRSRGLASYKLQRICILWYLNPSLLLPNNTWMVMHFFFMYIAVQSRRKIRKVQNFQFARFYQKKMCMSYSSSWTVFLKFKRQASTVQHLSDFSKNVLFFKISWAQRHLGLCVNVS